MMQETICDHALQRKKINAIESATEQNIVFVGHIM